MIVLEWLFLTIAPCDAAEPWKLGSQDAATPIMQGITDLHHDVFFFVILILVFVSWILGRALWHDQFPEALEIQTGSENHSRYLALPYLSNSSYSSSFLVEVPILVFSFFYECFF